MRLGRRLRRRVARLRGRIPASIEPFDPGGLVRSPGFHEGRLYARSSGRAVAVTDPPVVPARELALGPDEICIGVELGGEARLYPVSLLEDPHIVNDRVGGVPTAVTFCVNCRSGVVFDPMVDGSRLLFEAFGGYEGALVMTDDRTGTHWSQLSGEALAGRLAGRSLRLLPGEFARLGSWLERHPGSTAPDPSFLATRGRRPRATMPTRAWRRTISVADHRVPQRALVLGVQAGGETRAYVIDPSRPGVRFCLDEIGGVPVALLAPPGAWPRVYDAMLDGHRVRLRGDGARLVDETGSVWDWAGRAVSGPRSGASLEPLPSVITEWYAWAAHHPGSDVVFLSGASRRRHGRRRLSRAALLTARCGG